MSITAPHINPLASPAFSTDSYASSFDFLSLSGSSAVSPQDSDSDDVIVWGTSVSPSLDGDVPVSDGDDDDFAVLARPRRGAQSGPPTPSTEDHSRPQTPSVEKLTWCLSSLTVRAETSTVQDNSVNISPSPVPPTAPAKPSGAARRRKKRLAKAANQTGSGAYPSPSSQLERSPPSATTAQPNVSSRSRCNRKEEKRNVDAVGLGTRGPVDDISECAPDIGESISLETAAGYITRFLSDPLQNRGQSERLKLLQSLIIEFGLAASSNALPASLTAAKALLKTHAFVNIREYLAVRGQGPTAVRNILFSSKSALIRDMKRNHNNASLGAVKKSGLQVLLVPVRHR